MFKSKKGQSTVEFALLLPAMIFLIVVIVEVGMFLNTYVTLVSISRDAARVAIVGIKTDEEIQSALSSVDIEISPAPADRVKGVPVTVTASREYNQITGFISFAFPETVSAQTVMMME